MIKVTVLGNNSALPAYGRHPTAQIIEIRDQLFLMDCGEGTQMQISKYHIHWGHIDHIFISHLHGDHYFGLIGLLSSMALWNRQKPLSLYGPALLKDILDIQLNSVGATLPFVLHFKAIEPGYAGTLVNTEYYAVSCFPVNHGTPCHGFVFCEKSTGRKINPEACQAEGIPRAFYSRLKNGENYRTKSGTIVKNASVTFDAPPDKQYVFCADTLYDPSIVPFLQQADLVYHESTFLKADEEKALKRYHSTAEQAAKIAMQANIKHLLLGHYSSRYEEILPFEEEAKVVFAASEASVEGNSYFVK